MKAPINKVAQSLSGKMLAAFDAQQNACDLLGSPLTRDMVRFFRDDFASDGIIADLVRGWQGDALSDNVPLRLAGFAHFQALDGAPQLTPFFESCGGQYAAAQSEALRASLRQVFFAKAEMARPFLRRVPQTNETGRAGMLLLGFSEISKKLRLPLRLCEMGASAGLNLFFDKFHYRIATDDGLVEWGDAASPLILTPSWHGPPPPLNPTIEVAARLGCDLRPVDLTDATQNKILQSWVWGDMPERRARLMAAIDIALTAPPQIDRADAAGWVAAQIMNRPRGQATVLYHSIVWPYLSVAQRFAIESAFAQAAETVTPDAPLVWLKMDGRDMGTIAQLSYTVWTGENGPSGEHVVVGSCHPHGLDMQIEAAF